LGAGGANGRESGMIYLNLFVLTILLILAIILIPEVYSTHAGTSIFALRKL
jgi:hypothetical protein